MQVVSQSRVQEVLKKVRQARKANPREFQNPFRRKEVAATDDFWRIVGLESRDWELTGKELAARMTPLLRAEGGTQTLRDIQAVALHDLGVYGGCVSFTRVGGGKTLMTMLAPYVVEAFRPLLLIPADLRQKTENDLLEYRQNWRIPNFLRIEHYEKLSNRHNEYLLDDYRPDLILLDEASAMKDPDAICTKRMGYYVNDCEKNPDYPDPKFLITSGTLTNDSIKDYWHLLMWALQMDKVPMPITYPELEQWALCLDEKVGEMHRVKPGALLQLCNDEEKELAKTNALKAARKAFRRRLICTPGIVSTTKTFQGASLRVKEWKREVPDEVKQKVQHLRKTWERPDGEWLEEGHLVAACAKTLALGFFYVWDPMPPDWWLKPRKAWFKACRRIVRVNRRRLDSESMIREAMDTRGLYPEHQEKLDAWRAVEKEYIPEVKDIWVHDFAIRDAIRWGKKHKGIIWTYHRAFARRLAKESKFPYYHHKGFSDKGKYIEEHVRGSQKPLIASIRSNFKGKNLQFITNKNVVFGAMASGDWWEQLIGRTHRDRQPEDHVDFDVFSSCREHMAAMWQAIGNAEYVQDTTNQEQKLLFGDVMIPTLDEVDEREGPMWGGSSVKQDDEREATE